MSLIYAFLVFLAVLLYIKGECETKLLGKPDKIHKMMLGIPLGILSGLIVWIMGVITYIIAGSMGYGENNWLTKLVGEKWAITICGVLLGLASFPIIGDWSILQAIISGATWYYLRTQEGKINEPFVAIWRALSSTILIPFVM
jgi:hypothetical protein